MADSFRDELTHLINRHSRENASDTPDFILAQFMEGALTAYETAQNERDRWWGFQPWAGRDEAADPPATPATGPAEEAT